MHDGQTLTDLPASDLRTREILLSIKGVFQQKGFDGASMQDLARAAGMSVGNFYRYFASKDAIIAAMVAHDLREVADTFSHILESDDPRRTFLASLRRELVDHRESCDGSLWAEIDAAALRSPAIAAITQQMEREILRYLLETFALITGRPLDEMKRFADHAWLVIAIFKAVGSKPDATSDMIDLSIDTIDQILDRVVAAATPHRSIPNS